MFSIKCMDQISLHEISPVVKHEFNRFQQFFRRKTGKIMGVLGSEHRNCLLKSSLLFPHRLVCGRSKVEKYHTAQAGDGWLRLL